MNAHTRRTRILELLEKQGSLQVPVLAKTFNASFNTIRADLDALEAEGRLQRVRGGAARLGAPVLDGSRRTPAPAAPRLPVDSPCSDDDIGPERDLGAAAAALVEDGEAIVLDASAAACHLARRLSSQRGLTVVTTGLAAALQLAQEPSNKVILAANEIAAGASQVHGRLNEAVLEHFCATRAFVSAAGFTLRNGLTDSSEEQALIRRALVAHAGSVVALLEGRALGRVAAYRFAEAEQVSHLLVAGPVDEAALEPLRARAGLTVTLLPGLPATPFTPAGD